MQYFMNRVAGFLYFVSYLITPFTLLAQLNKDATDPKSVFLSKKTGIWDVVMKLQPQATATPIIVKGLTADRSMIGSFCMHEVMQPVPGTGTPAFQRVSDLAYNKNEDRWDYISIDTRITGGIMYFTNVDAVKDSITSYISSVPHPGLGPDLKDRGISIHIRNVIVKVNDDHEILKQYWRFIDRPEWLAIQYEYTRKRNMLKSTTETQQIIGVIKSLFEGTDGREWQKVETCFAGNVLLDYTSMTGGVPATLSPQEITAAWKTILPGFDSTKHHITDFDVKQKGEEATVTNSGHAVHYMMVAGKQESWIVDGQYAFQLKKINNEWKVSAMKFTKEDISGNMKLPGLAVEKVKNGGK